MPMKGNRERFCLSLGFARLFALGVMTLASSAIAQTPGTFRPAGDMTTGRSFHRAVVLRDGKVLIVGESSAEIYDPAAGTLTAIGNLSTKRSIPTATLLDDGRVLTAGDDVLPGDAPLKSP